MQQILPDLSKRPFVTCILMWWLSRSLSTYHRM